MSKVDLPIGVFDSGVGGLTVLSALKELLPNENFLYLGDTARVPYGAKSSDSISRYAKQAADALINRGIKMLIIACNTMTAVAEKELAQHYSPMPVVGVIEPGALAACRATNNGRIGVIGTRSTIKGGAYQRTICRDFDGAVIKGQACPLFVGLAEEGWLKGNVVESIARKYLTPLFEDFGTEKPDTLVLGCTHFPLLKDAIANVVGEGVTLVDSAHTTALKVKEILENESLKSNLKNGGAMHFMATDSAESFSKVGSVFLGMKITPEEVEIIDL